MYDGEDDSELYQKDDIVEDLVVCDKRKEEEESWLWNCYWLLQEGSHCWRSRGKWCLNSEDEDKTSVEEDNEQEKEVFGFLVSVPRSDFNKC